MSPELKKRIITSFFLIALLVLIFFYSFIMICSIIIIATIVWIEFYALISKIILTETLKDKFLRFLFKLISLLYLSVLVYFMFSIMSYHPELKVYLLYSTIVTILSDIGGLVFGKIFKGKKLTKISPKKTISGTIGSFVFSLSVVPLFYITYHGYDLLLLIIITILTSLIAQLGDLFISYLKRKANVKDTSDLLPGHGGFLDRVDGLIFALPFGVLLFTFI